MKRSYLLYKSMFAVQLLSRRLLSPHCACACLSKFTSILEKPKPPRRIFIRFVEYLESLEKPKNRRDLIKRASMLWRTVDEKLHNSLIEEYERDLSEYRERLREFKKHLSDEQHTLLEIQHRRRKEEVSQQVRNQELRLYGKPKAPPSAIDLFLIKHNKKKSPNGINLWNDLTDAEKVDYYNKTEDLNRQYEIELEKWKERMDERKRLKLDDSDGEDDEQLKKRKMQARKLEILLSKYNGNVLRHRTYRKMKKIPAQLFKVSPSTSADKQNTETESKMNVEQMLKAMEIEVENQENNLEEIKKIDKKLKSKVPKKPASAYTMFVQEKMKQKRGTDIMPIESLSIVAKEWKNLPEEEKMVYRLKFESAKEKYKKLLAELKKNASERT